MIRRATIYLLIFTVVFAASSVFSQSPNGNLTASGFALIPSGEFQMGDHHNLGGQEHRNDEVPVHKVRLDPYYIGKYEVTNKQYCEFLNDALTGKSTEVRNGLVVAIGGKVLYCETRAAVPYSRIGWNDVVFSVLDKKENHPMIGVRWEGAAAYCNWLSKKQGLESCYNPATWKCDFQKNGFRLPTEAEWEFAGRGGLDNPYAIYPWGDEADMARANWPRSGDPFEAGPEPWTTPVGFYNGELRRRVDFDWPASQKTYQTHDGANGFGLYDMAGNVWEWCGDWYTSDYYAASPSVNPEGPASGRPMRDGQPYRVLRSGNWYNGPEGHSRVSNRNPGYYRGPQDPNHPYYHIGFRVVRDFSEDGPRKESGSPQIIETTAVAPRTEERRPRGQGGDRGDQVGQQNPSRGDGRGERGNREGEGVRRGAQRQTDSNRRGGQAARSGQDRTPGEVRGPGRGGQNRGGQTGGGRGGDGRNRQGGRGGQGQGGQTRGGQGGGEEEFRTDVPKHPVDTILGRPTKDSITLSVLAYQDAEGYISWNQENGSDTQKTEIMRFSKGDPVEIALKNLKPDARHAYQLHYRAAGTSDFLTEPAQSFHTARAPGKSFVFTVQADSHLDYNTEPEIYTRTLKNALLDQPDFHIDLGDTFMTGKYRGRLDDARMQYIAQRYYFGLLSRSTPLFLVLGNHDGESGQTGSPAMLMRKQYFPNPVPNDFFTGNTERLPSVGYQENYYAWHWGGALFIVLDPFTHTQRQRGGQRGDNWNRTLGKQQYDWLKKTLEESKVPFKFLFIHHLVGGLDQSGRGGSEAAGLYEWGGRGASGDMEFAEKRPGWEAPIHYLLVRAGVDIVFHGHDHFFAKQDLDGVVYHLVPQPGHRRYGAPRNAAEYGYVDGVILGGPGHLRVTVSESQAVIDYILSAPPEYETGSRKNRDLAYSYTISLPAKNEPSAVRLVK